MVLEEMERRSKAFNRCFTDNIIEYNKKAVAEGLEAVNVTPTETPPPGIDSVCYEPDFVRNTISVAAPFEVHGTGLTVRHGDETAELALPSGGSLAVSLKRQTKEDIRSYVEAADLPFIVKGVLSVSDALKCAEAGAKGIVISHHRGRMPFAIPPLMVLPEIKKALGDDCGMELFVDCGISSGADAYKALAMGAKAVSVGRAIMPGLASEGTEGVKKYVTAMNQELATIMGYTGVSTVNDFAPDTLWVNGSRMTAE